MHLEGTKQLFHNVQRTNYIGEEDGAEFLGEEEGLEFTNAEYDWSINIPGGGHQPPVVQKSDIYVTSGKGRIHKINGNLGKGEWRSPILGTESNSEDREVLPPYIGEGTITRLYVTVLNKSNYEVTGSLSVISDNGGEIKQTYTDQNYMTEAVSAPELPEHAFLGVGTWVHSVQTETSHMSPMVDYTDTDHNFPIYGDLAASAKTDDEKKHLSAVGPRVFAPVENTLFIYNTNKQDSEAIEFGVDEASFSTIFRCVTATEEAVYVPVVNFLDVDSGVYEIIAYDYVGGVHLWKNEVDTRPTGAIATNFEKVFVPTKSSIIAFDAADGSREWERKIRHSLANNSPTQPVVTDQTVFAHYHQGNSEFGLIALDAETGEEIFTFEYPHDSPPVTYPVFYRMYFVYRTEDGNVHRITLKGDITESQSDTVSNSDEPIESASDSREDDAPAPDVIVCRNCDHESDSESNFCSNCGTELPQSQCTNCGVSVDPTNSYCSNCGERLN